MSKPARVQALYLALLSITVLVCMWARPRESGFSSTSIAPPPPEAPPVVAAIPPPPEAFAPPPWLPPPPEALAPPPWPFFEWWGGAGGDPCEPGRGCGPGAACVSACVQPACGSTTCRCRIGGDGRGDQCAAAAPRPRVIIAPHHKTGTSFSFTTLRVLPELFPDVDFLFGMVDAAAAGDAPADFLYHVGLDGAGLPGHEWLRRARRAPIPALLRGASTASRLVHLVRDPFELVVSAYLYHLSAPPEERWWLDEPALFAPPPCARGSRASWLEALRACDAAGGLAAEGARAIAKDIAPMAALSRAFACEKPARYLQLDIAELGRDLDGALRRLARFVADAAGRGADAALIERCVARLREQQASALASAYGSAHVTEGKHDKAALRRVLAADAPLARQLSEFGAALRPSCAGG